VQKYDIIPPEPSALIESLRSVGYTLPAAVADLVDNSITAQARTISVTFHWAGAASHMVLLDDGRGMSEEQLRNAMRPGSQNPLQNRAPSDLGRFGLGLKTASFSQCRNLCVATKAVGGPVSTRTWDLDALAASSEWRLLKDPPKVADSAISQLASMPSGTVVVWSALDRLVGEDNVGDAAANDRFNDAIDYVRDHLALTFHRFLEDGSFKLQLNEKPVLPWNPFLTSGNVTSAATPEEYIPFARSGVRFQGFVMPHKDALGEKEFRASAGPRGWTAQQGFYVYRNRRLLVFGDWLRLGRPTPWTREEQFRLARIRLDILNDSDSDWHLDVKKSTARPPALIRDRLTDLADAVRTTARSVFAHRGKYGKRLAVPMVTERPWVSTVRASGRAYSINRNHPLVQAVLKQYPDKSPELDALLRLLEETVPVEQIWLDAAEQTQDHAAPYSGLDLSIIRSDMRRVLEFLLQTGINRATALERLRSIEPFDRYKALINEL
jgi:hypothetical protein